MPGPSFLFRNFCNEIAAMRDLANSGKFLTNPSSDRLQEFQETVTRVQMRKDSTVHRIEISKDWPLETRPSPGDYRPGSKEKRQLIGQLAIRWHIRPTGTRKKRTGFPGFIVDTEAGVASTRIAIKVLGNDDDEPEEKAVWRSDIRTTHGPGCFYHIQVLGESDDKPFPDFMGIPRFPDPFTTPMAVLEFLISELFPERWEKHLSDGAYSSGEWRESQKEHWLKRLEAQKKVVSGTSSSPWLSILSWSPCSPNG
jgi:hypothetical protein